MSKYCCLILTKNEERTIAQVMRDTVAQFTVLGIEAPAFVVSDDSNDGTAEIAQKEGAYVVSAGGYGLGQAYLQGIRKCAELAADRILLLDGDGQADLADLKSFIVAMDESGAALVTGSRFLSEDSILYAYPRLNRIGVWFLSRYLSWTTGQRFTDSHGGFRLMTRELAGRQEIFGRQTYVQESIVDAVGKGFRVVEITSAWKARKFGNSRVVASAFRYARRTLPYLVYRAIWILGKRKAVTK